MIFRYIRKSDKSFVGIWLDFDCVIAEIEAETRREADFLFHLEVGPIPRKEPSWIGVWCRRDFSFTPPTQDKLEWIENGGYTPQPTI